MNFAAAESIANAVLYEGYVLYPYRATSTKNRQRWNFGTLYPRRFAEAQVPAESCCLASECLLEGDTRTKVTVRTRFLQLTQGRNEQAWNEGIDRAADREFLIADLLAQSCTVDLGFGGESDARSPLVGQLSLFARELQPGAYKLSIEFANSTAEHATSRNEALPLAFSSAHLLLGAESGHFISLLDPPESYKVAASECRNQGVFPVLVGDDQQNTLMLCSPIILYDYPKVAPESAGDFFDSTEMDEMLQLRVLTLTDEEKQEMKQLDARAQAILERAETLPPEVMMKLHGAVRGLRRVGEEKP